MFIRECCKQCSSLGSWLVFFLPPPSAMTAQGGPEVAQPHTCGWLESSPFSNENHKLLPLYPPKSSCVLKPHHFTPVLAVYTHRGPYLTEVTGAGAHLRCRTFTTPQTKPDRAHPQTSSTKTEPQSGVPMQIC